MKAVKMGNTHKVREDEYVPRKHTDRKHSRKQMREDKRNVGNSESDREAEAFNKGACSR